MRYKVIFSLVILLFNISFIYSDISTDIIKSADAVSSAKRIDAERELNQTEQQLKNIESNIPKISINKIPYFISSYDLKEIDSFYVDELIFNNSDYISEKYLDYIKNKFENNVIDTSIIVYILNQINLRYFKQGNFFAKAVLAEHNIKAGKVYIYFVEPKFGRVIVTGNKTTKESYIKRIVSIYSGQLFDIEKLQKKMLDFNFSHDISARLSLAPGEEFATTDIKIDVNEPEKRNTFLLLDNYGRKETGKFRTNVAHTERSLSGKRDTLTLNIIGSRGSLDAITAYNFFNMKTMDNIGFSLRRTQTEIVSGGLKNLKIESFADSYSIYLKKIVKSFNNGVRNLTYILDRSNNKTLFSGAKAFDGKTGKLSIKLDRINYKKSGFFYSSYNFSKGSEFFGDSGSYSIFSYTLINLEKIKNDSLKTVFNVQIASDSFVPSGGRFQLGGANSIRAYPDGLISGDNGFNLSGEYSFEKGFLIRDESINETLFLDFGKIFALKDKSFRDDNHTWLASAGIILRSKIKNYDFDLTCSYALKKHVYNDENRLKTIFQIYRNF